MFEEFGGVSSLEKLEQHPNSDIQEQAQDLIDQHFGDDDCEDVDY